MELSIENIQLFYTGSAYGKVKPCSQFVRKVNFDHII